MAVELRAERLNRGHSLATASEEIGVDRDVLRRAEEGEGRPHPRNAFAIATFYGYKVTDVWPLEKEAA